MSFISINCPHKSLCQYQRQELSRSKGCRMYSKLSSMATSSRCRNKVGTAMDASMALAWALARTTGSHSRFTVTHGHATPTRRPNMMGFIGLQGHSRWFHGTTTLSAKRQGLFSSQQQQKQPFTIRVAGPGALIALMFAMWGVSDWVLQDKQQQKNARRREKQC